MAPGDPSPPSSQAELEAVRASDPDPMGLMDVMELIAPQARVTGWHRLPGGLGAAMHRIDVTMPSGAQTGFVLRRYLPEIGQDGAVATREAATLEALRDTPVPSPDVLWLDADGAVFGRPTLAMTLPGRPRAAEVAVDPGLLRGLAEALVSLRWVPTDRLDHLPVHTGVAALTRPLREAEALPRSELVDTRATVDTLLAHAGALAAEPAALSHGDFHVGNVRFDGVRVVGILGWDHARVTDPRGDVAACALDLALLAGLDTAETFLAEHAALRGPMADEAWWRLRATTGALPDPLGRVSSWHALGVEVSTAQVAERFVAWVQQARADLDG